MIEVSNQYLIGDARDLHALLPSREFVDVTISSPPYWNLKDYGSAHQIGFGQNYDAYLSDITTVCKSVFDITKESGSLWLITDTFKHRGKLRLLPFDIAARLESIGWILQDVVIWQKDRTLPWSHQGKLRNIFEYISFFSKGPNFKYDIGSVRELTGLKDYWQKYPERYNPEGRAPSRMWEMPIPRQGSWGRAANILKHECPLPIELVSRIVALTTDAGDVVLDPFAGSGVVLATASALDRRYIGVDLQKRYQSLFHDRVLPAVTEQIKRIPTDANDKARAAFASHIWMLRRLKIGRELLRIYRQAGGTVGCQALFAFPGKTDQQLFLIVVLREDAQRTSEAHAFMSDLMKRPPLSKYGLQVELKAYTVRASKRSVTAHLRVAKASVLARYSNGRFYQTSETVAAADVITSLADSMTLPRGYPPIYSTLSMAPSSVQSSNAKNNGSATK